VPQGEAGALWRSHGFLAAGWLYLLTPGILFWISFWIPLVLSAIVRSDTLGLSKYLYVTSLYHSSKQN
jgi:hypothetical protein